MAGECAPWADSGVASAGFYTLWLLPNPYTAQSGSPAHHVQVLQVSGLGFVQSSNTTKRCIPRDWRHRHLSSDDSGEIDQKPHRPPSPARDFDAYSAYVASLSNEEYHRVFSDGWPGWDPRESDSDVDSNERAIRGYTLSEEEAGLSHPGNTINTIGSREEAMRQFTPHQWRTNQRDNRVTLPQTPQRWSGQHYLDNAVPLEEAIQDEVRSANNLSQRAAGSNEVVVIPARSHTVPPPPPARRLPPLEVQMGAPRVKENPAVGAKNQPTQENIPFGMGQNPAPEASKLSAMRTHRQGRSGNMSQARTTAVTTPLRGVSSGWKIVHHKGQDELSSVMGWELLGVGFALGIIVGGVVVMVVMSCMSCNQSKPSDTISVENSLRPTREAERPVQRRTRKRSRPLFLTPQGECVH